MSRIKFVSFLLFLVIIVAGTARYSNDYDTLLTPQLIDENYTPGIVLTFDDDYLDDWYNAEKLLRPYNWKATFFICKYNTLTPKEKSKLHYLKHMGHDIAGHGYNHLNALKYTAQYGIENYMSNEILPLKAAMRRDGFTITSFAYPDGAHSDVLDKRLLECFDFVRGTTYGELPPKYQYCYYQGNGLINGLGIDDDYKQFNLPYYKSLMLYAKENNKIVIFYGHKTVDNANGKLETPYEALQQLCEFAVNNNLKFYTVDDLKHLQ